MKATFTMTNIENENETISFVWEIITEKGLANIFEKKQSNLMDDLLCQTLAKGTKKGNYYLSKIEITLK